MPLQDYQAQVESTGLPGRPYPRFPDSVSPQETGEPIGRGIEEAGQIAAQVYHQAITSQVTDAHNQLQALALQTTHDPKTGAFTKQGQAAFNLEQQYMPGFDQAAQQIVDNVPQGIGRQHAQTAMAEIRNSVLSQLDTHEGEQHRQFAVQTAKSSVGLAQQAAAANYNHPDIIANNLETMDVSLKNLAQTQGWSSDMLAEAQHQAHVQFHQGVLTNMLADNKVDLAKNYLDQFKGELKPEEVKLATNAINAGQSKAMADSIMKGYQTDTTTGARLMTNLQNSGLTQDQQFDVVREVSRQREALEAERRQDPHVQNQLMALEESIAREKPSPNAIGTVETLWRRGAISDDQRASLRGHIERINDKLGNEEEAKQFYRTAYATSQPMDPGDSQTKKGIDWLFGDMTQNAQPGSTEWANRAVDITHRTGVVPQGAVQYSTASLVSGDPAAASRAADLMERLQETNPRSMEFVDTKTKALAGVISGAVKAGADPKSAVETARANAQMDERTVKFLDSEYTKGKFAQSQASKLADLLGQDERYKSGGFLGFGGSVPSVPPGMQSQFDELTKEYYLRTGGNIQQARAMAVRDLKNVWGVSEVNGQRELMPYAPEAMFPGLTKDVIRNDIAETVKGVDASKVRLVEDPQRTARTSGSQWNLVAPDENGLFDVIRDENGRPKVYQLPVTKNDYAATRARIAQKQLAEARVVQQQRETDRRLQDEADQDRESPAPELWVN